MLRTRTFQSLSASDDIKVLYDKISKLEPVVITHALSGFSFPEDGDIINITESKYNQLVSAFDNFNPVIIRTQCSSIRCYAVPYASEGNGNTYSTYNYKMFLNIPSIGSSVDEENSFGRYSYINIPLKSKIKEDGTYDLVYKINKNDLSIYDYNIEGITADQLVPETIINNYNQNYYTGVKKSIELGGRLYLNYSEGGQSSKLRVSHLSTSRNDKDENNYYEVIVCEVERDSVIMNDNLLLAFMLDHQTDPDGSSSSTYQVIVMGNNIIKSDVEKVLVGNVSSHYHDSMYLNKTNTSSFTPTSNYHPATKKYVDDKLGTIATYNTNGLIKPYYSYTTSSTGPEPFKLSSSVTVNSRASVAGRYYPLEIDINGRGFVNVPWNNNITKSQVEEVLTGTITSHNHESTLYLSSKQINGDLKSNSYITITSDNYDEFQLLYESLKNGSIKHLYLSIDSVDLGNTILSNHSFMFDRTDNLYIPFSISELINGVSSFSCSVIGYNKNNNLKLSHHLIVLLYSISIKDKIVIENYNLSPSNT